MVQWALLASSCAFVRASFSCKKEQVISSRVTCVESSAFEWGSGAHAGSRAAEIERADEEAVHCEQVKGCEGLEGADKKPTDG